MRTENNIPNAKVIAMTIAMIIYGWVNYYTETKLGLTIPIELATSLGGLFVGVVGYITPPSKRLGDGVIEK